MKKNESKQRKLTKKMKIKLAGVFGCSLLALVGLLVGITWINAKSGNKYTSKSLPIPAAVYRHQGSIPKGKYYRS